MHLPFILFPTLLSYNAFCAPVTSDEPKSSLEARNTPSLDPKVIKPFLQSLNGKIDPKIIKPFLLSLKGKILPRDTNDVHYEASSFRTKVSRRDVSDADNNNGTDAEDESDIIDFHGPVDEDDEVDGDDLLDKPNTPSAEEDDTASASPVGNDADGEDGVEDGDEDFSALYDAGDDGDNLLDKRDTPTAEEEDGTAPTSPVEDGADGEDEDEDEGEDRSALYGTGDDDAEN